jgi:hypothetical protein
MKKLLFLSLLCTLVSFAHGQAVLPNISYNGYLNSTCTNANTSCSNGVFVTSFGGSTNAGPLGSGSTLDIPVANYSAATVTVSGTYAGSTINFDFSDPTSGTNYFQEVCARTDINLLEVSEVLPTNQVRAWQCPVWAATRFRVRQSAYTSGNVNVWITLTQAAIDPSLVVAASITNIAGASDPCADVSAPKSSVPINISSATTTQLVALSGSTVVYVCGYTAAAGAGTNPSIQFEYGTGSTCGTGTTVITGAMATGVTVATGVPGPIFYAGPDATVFKTAAGAALCAVTGGTTPNFQGYLSYVQQ